MMQTVVLPFNLNNDIDKLIRNSLWGNTAFYKHIHLLAWDKACYDKINGGLGLNSAHKVNEAHMLAWCLNNDPNALWSRILRDKYLKVGSVVFANSQKTNQSPLSKRILSATKHLPNTTMWALGIGHMASFWTSRWVEDLDCLTDYTLVNIPNVWKPKSVINYA